MHFLYLLFVGLIAGFLADKVVKNSFSLLGDMIIGVIGSYLGGWLFDFLNFNTNNIIGQIFAAFVGAVLLLLLINYFKGRK